MQSQITPGTKKVEQVKHLRKVPQRKKTDSQEKHSLYHSTVCHQHCRFNDSWKNASRIELKSYKSFLQQDICTLQPQPFYSTVVL